MKMHQKLSIIWRLFVVLFCVACSQAQSAWAAQPLGNVFSNMPGADWQMVQDTAAAQAAGAPYYKSNAVESIVFEGYFKPADSTAKLAIFSDDGADVYIDGNKVHSGKGTGQALPNLSQSLHQISANFDPARIYHIKIDFSNLVLTGDTDIDGITLFCFGGGGTIVTECGSYKHEKWIKGKITWSYDEATQSQQPSASNATEVCKWNDPCGNTTKPNERHSVAYVKTGDETIKTDPDNKKTWIRRVTFRASSKCGGLNSTLVDEKNYCSCFKKDMPGSVPMAAKAGVQSRAAVMAVPVVIPAVLKWLAHKGGKKAAIASFKKLLKEQVKARVKNALKTKFVSRDAARQFTKEADDLLSILDNNSWQEWVIDCLPGAQDLQLAYKLKEAYGKAQALRKRVEVAIKAGQRIQALRKKLLAKVSNIINRFTGRIKQKYPDVKFGIRGSLAIGEKGPHKGYALFDPAKFDVDAYIVSDQLAALIAPNSKGFRSGGSLPEIAQIQSEIQKLLRQRVPGYQGGFTFRVFSSAEFARLNPKGVVIG